ncbi:ABC-three component system middle component 6 [Rodentibacter pneumotropicus]|uniref:ABC-three component system middle component 6 n=1 Tax=Rodentibacter pneumotropicus TaxID=758 RepID=UPI00113CD196|nr:hypothetical protein D3M79_10815 [Rodentibacter pneumotropicus]THA03828.1 hypothetical protein D3M77_11310 [Rodentibacter pneumotropicus]
MLLNETSPDKSLYIIGANILKNLQSKTYSVYSLYDLCYKDRYISLTLFLFALDWLFLIGMVKLSDKGVSKCI